MRLHPYSAAHFVLGLVTGRLLQGLPEKERAIWTRCILFPALLWLAAATLLAGCTIEAEGHKLALTPLPGWQWSYTGTTTNGLERAR